MESGTKDDPTDESIGSDNNTNLDSYSEREFSLFAEEMPRRAEHQNRSKSAAIRYSFLLNGGAAVATMGLLASLRPNVELATLNIIGLGLMVFAIGAAASSISAFRYQQASEASLHELHFYWLKNQSFTKGTQAAKIREFRRGYEKLSYTGVIISHSAFITGMLIVGSALLLPVIMDVTQQVF